MKEYLIISTDTDSVEYRVIQKDDKYTLYYSNAEHWTLKNKEILSAKDTGDGIEWGSEFIQNMDYSTFEHVWILMRFIRKGLNNDEFITLEK